MLITTTEFAKQAGVSQRAVAKAIKVGRVPAYDETGTLAPAGARGRIFVKADEAIAAFRLSRARIDDATVAETAAELDRENAFDAPDSSRPATPPQDGSLVAAKKDKELLQSDILRLRLARERGELVSRQMQLEAFETAGRAVGRQFQTMASWAEEINGVARSGGVHALTVWLRSKANELCSQLADLLTGSELADQDDDHGDD